MENLEEKEILPDVKNIKSQETYTLPSKGLVYAETDNIPASITLRRMTTKEDKLRLRNESEENIRKDLLQACILDQGVDAGKLKLMDANFLLFRLRSLSLLNDNYKVYCRCNNCGTEFVHEVNLSEIPIKFMNEENLKYMVVTLPISGAVITLRYPSINDIITMGDTLREFTTQFPNADAGEYLYSLSTAIYIDNVNNNVLLREELENYFDNLDILDSRVLREAINKLDNGFGFEDNLKTKCPSCNKEITHGLPITSELFTPSK